MNRYDPMKFRCKLCGDVVFSHYSGHMNECKCGNLVVQEDIDGYNISTNVEDTSELVLLDFDELEPEQFRKEYYSFFKEADDDPFDESSDFPF